jgi:hypothetical protein
MLRRRLFFNHIIPTNQHHYSLMPQQLLLRVRVLEALLDLLIPELQLHFMLGMMHRQQQLIVRKSDASFSTFY